MRGACGYEDVVQEGYGLETAALSEALFNKGQGCGSCYEIKCVDDPKWCKPGQLTLMVTGTNNCPPNWNQASDNGGWCNPPREHFDIAKPAFAKIAEYKAGIVPIMYRRVPCMKKGGIKFTITGNPYFNQVLVWNVGGAGEVTSLQVKGNKNLKWTAMKRLWGQKWETDAKMVGESLTFRVRGSDGRYSTSWHVAPNNWQFGQTFEGKNFKFKPSPWKRAHATFYEGGSGTFGGACGYHDVVKEGYGLETVALSDALFNKGQSCGSCFEIKCVDSPQWCKPGQPVLAVTATNHCPPNWNQPSDNGGWCNPPREHFDIAKPVFLNIVAQHKAGIVPVEYRRVPCKKKGGIRFTITGNPYFNEVLVWNAAGSGDVTSVEVKGGKLQWTPLERMWGQRWVTGAKLSGEALTFRVGESDGRTITSVNVAPRIGSLARPTKARTLPSLEKKHVMSSNAFDGCQ
ncbi:expansin A9 [Prunus dulcis]|uniref:Expansin A9 n=1 Tax=Prunus dulcis TaxID=3755 RepID=A0A4Y1RTR4_PRUDU|nr:expansin A9 [Prunus dulcis]